MTIHKKIFNGSAWLALLSIFFIPGTLQTEGGPLHTEYGFPLRFLTDYHISNPEASIWFISGMHINLLVYFVNVLFIYTGLHIILYIKKRITEKDIR
ncbi:hypothetical protein ACN9MH_21925 [Paenibacillus silvae]|jgi:hypothetical protein|uniref:hypothetical protein n=1 Tax=Paenibacillus silvae TaxID=1325358 RepID=UPI003CF58A48